MTTYLKYLHEIISIRIKNFNSNAEEFHTLILEEEDGNLFSKFLIRCELSFEEIILLLLAFVPHLQPNFFDTILSEHFPKGGDFPEFGGVRGTNHRGILPTGETALFILAGNDLEKRLALFDLFSSDHFFAKENILHLEEVKSGEPRMSGRLILDAEYLELFTMGKISAPQYGSHFPAKKVETQLVWGDVVLSTETRRQIRDIENWINHFHLIQEDKKMGKYAKPGYRALFYGLPGTGKTLTATLLGKYTNREVYCIDLSLVVSKYIGETEKNLGSLFDKAQSRNWILCFNEADALFGKRTETNTAHDRYANQEVAYLLQKIEEFDGLVILTSNLKSNIDPAFARRFQCMAHFPMPNAQDRLLLWEKYLPTFLEKATDISLKELADKYELTGASIANVIQLCVLRVLGNQQSIIELSNIIDAIRLEFQKEGKLIV